MSEVHEMVKANRLTKVEFSADTGAPRIIIQANPTWEAWVEICEAVWVTALEGGCNYWIDDLKYDDDSYHFLV